jgi:hypothetical protein
VAIAVGAVRVWIHRAALQPARRNHRHQVTATGAITAASNPKQPIGAPVSITLVGGGQGLQLWMAGGDQGFPFCNITYNDADRHYDCGA